MLGQHGLVGCIVSGLHGKVGCIVSGLHGLVGCIVLGLYGKVEHNSLQPTPLGMQWCI